MEICFLALAPAKKCGARIAEGCDLLVTNSRYHADWLEREPVRQSAAPSSFCLSSRL